MKKTMLLTAVMLLLSSFLMAQKVPYKVVFDVTSKDSMVHKSVMRWVNGIMTANPEAEMEVVFYGKSLDMVTKDKSAVASDVLKYAQSKNVTFRVCEAAMKNNNVQKDQLLEGVGTVPDGIYEIILKQHDGWGYIKAAQ